VVVIVIVIAYLYSALWGGLCRMGLCISRVPLYVICYVMFCYVVLLYVMGRLFESGRTMQCILYSYEEQ
jgi:hypothetical protein